MLLNTKRRVLYLHGHIHDDPLETVASPLLDGGILVIISAPELVDGYNLIEIEYTSSGLPLGCRVKAYRIHNGILSLSRVAEIPLGMTESVAPTADHSQLLDAVNQHRILYWREASQSTGLADDDLEAVATELHWRRLLKLDRTSSDRALWLLRRMY
jgi:hypothetical protein